MIFAPWSATHLNIYSHLGGAGWFRQRSSPRLAMKGAPMTQHSIDPKLERDRLHHDTRRTERPWDSWYRSPIWKSIRRHRLAEEPQCRECAIEGRTVLANHVDHVEPHRGEWSLFMQYENTQSLCLHHHNAHRYQERKLTRPITRSAKDMTRT